MSRADPFIKAHFDCVNTVTYGDVDTRQIAHHLASQITAHVDPSEITYSIMGRVGSGKSCLSEGLRSYYIPANAKPLLTSKLIGRVNPAWQLWTFDHVTFKSVDTAALDIFEDPVPETSTPIQVRAIEFARPEIQEQSVAVLEIAKPVDNLAEENGRLLNVYLNRDLLKDKIKRIKLRP